MRFCAVVMGFIGLTVPSVRAQTAGMLSFQGLIKDSGGNPITTPVDLEFRIFDAQSSGMLKGGPYGPVNVTPANGIVSTSFGPVLPGVFDGAPRWLEVRVNGSALPRIEMATAPAAAEQVNWPGTGDSAIHVDSSTGFVGIGTTMPQQPLDVAGALALNGQRVLEVYGQGTTCRLGDIVSLDGVINRLELRTNDDVRVVVDGEGDIGVGTTPDGDSSLHIQRWGTPVLKLQDSQTGTFWWMRQNAAGTEFVIGNTANVIDDQIKFRIRADGTTQVKVLQITGADVAEKFPSSEPLAPGMVVVIDPERPGQLKLATEPYDRKVAGIASGANDFPAGAILGNLPGQDDAPAIALAGRVWCWCDAAHGAIEPGDRLTTSDTPGHAMKVADRERADGAVIGKAMTPLADGRGLVLVLVQPQ